MFKTKYLKGAVRVFVSYGTSLLLFVIFLSIVLGFAGDSISSWLSVYCFVFFILLFYLLYFDMKEHAIKEKRPQYDLKPYPWKGFILGLLGFSPLFLLEAIYPFVVFSDEMLNRAKHLALNTLLGPLFGFIKLGNETAAAYILSSLLVPLIAALGYALGYYGISPLSFLKKAGKGNEENKGPVKK